MLEIGLLLKQEVLSYKNKESKRIKKERYNNMRIVDSNLVAGVSYDRSSKTLTVALKSGGTDLRVYRYTGVSKHTYTAFNAAESKSSFFASKIRPRHRATRLL